ncbi:MAG: cytochrome P450 [Acidimicrobiales bacterium]
MPAIEGWIVTTRSAAVTVMRDATTFTVDDKRFTTSQVVGPSMLSTDGPEHRRHRRPFNEPYRASSIDRLIKWMKTDARSLVSGLVPSCTADLRRSLARPLAARSVHESLGMVDTEPATLLDWYNEIADSVDKATAGGGPTAGGLAAVSELKAAVRDTVKTGPNSLLARVAPLAADVDELARNAAIVLFGALETAESTTSNALWHLLENQEVLRTVARDRSVLTQAVDESMRLEPAAAVVDRYATEDVELGGAAIEAGHLVRVSLAGANRDPEAHVDPDAFRLDRSDEPAHVTFAQGPHTCLGAHMAKAQTAAAVDAVIDLLPDVALDRDRSPSPTGLVFRKPAAVVARWRS